MLEASAASGHYPGLQRPHFMVPEDGLINVNDGGTGSFYPAQRLKERKNWETLASCGHTNLRLVDDGSERVYSFKGMEESKVWE